MTAQINEKHPNVLVGDIAVSKFGNRWTIVAVEGCAYLLHNVPPEVPSANGTKVHSDGELPQWVATLQRDGLTIWQRPTPSCKCEKFKDAKGPYPSGFCPDCKMYYPGISRARAIELASQEPKP